MRLGQHTSEMPEVIPFTGEGGAGGVLTLKRAHDPVSSPVTWLEQSGMLASLTPSCPSLLRSRRLHVTRVCLVLDEDMLTVRGIPPTA